MVKLQRTHCIERARHPPRRKLLNPCSATSTLLHLLLLLRHPAVRAAAWAQEVQNLRKEVSVQQRFSVMRARDARENSGRV